VRVCVVIPAYNEQALLPRLIARLDATPPPVVPAPSRALSPDPSTGSPEPSPLDRRIVLIDDGSTDGTGEVSSELARRPDIDAEVHTENRGQGSALRVGFARAIELDADLVIVQDADLEYDPADHQAVLAPILDGRADAVIGSRFIGQTHRVLYYWHSIANRVITHLSNALTNLNLTDVECCFKAFSRPVLERLDLREKRFGVEPEIVAKLARMTIQTPRGTEAVRVYEVAVDYAGRTYAEGKKITWRDGFGALRCILTYNLFDRS